MRRTLLCVVFCFINLASAFAYQTIPNGAWWSDSSGNWWYTNSSMGNIMVDDGVSGPVIPDTANFYRRTGESIYVERVRDSSFTTGSYCQNGNFYIAYQRWQDGNTGAYRGKFDTFVWNDSSNNTWATVHTGCSACFNLQASNGQYMSAASGGGGYGIACNRSAAYAWEEFTLWTVPTSSDPYFGDGDQLVIGTRDYLTFLTAEGGGGQAIVDNRTAVGSWEHFTIHKVAPAPGTANDRYIRSGDQVALSVDNGQYWSADSGGGAGITANRNSYGAWETFTITFVPPEPR